MASRLFVVASFVLAFLPSITTAVIAREPIPEPVRGPVIIGYLHHESGGLLAEDAARRLDPHDPAFD